VIRLAYVCADPGIPYGADKGAAVHMRELVAALADAGAEVLLVVTGISSDAPRLPEGVRLEVLPGAGKSVPASQRLRDEPARAAWLSERLRNFRACALYERLALHSAAGSRAARTLGIPHIVELNAPLSEEAARYRRVDAPRTAKAFEWAVLRHAALVLPVSSPLREYALRRGARSVEVTPNAVRDENLAIPLRPGDRPPTAVFAGALRPWHGIETIADAWQLLGAAAPRLVVLGDGPGRDLLAAVGAELVGTVRHEQVPRLLGRCAIGLAPYSRDAPDYFSPLKVFEYLAAGLAVVAGDLSGITDVLGPESAVLIPRGDPAALAQAVAELARDTERREALGRAGRALVASRHTWRLRADRVLHAVRELSELGVAA
jgi:glycosyltransferase involved in cell wall biosynthesis